MHIKMHIYNDFVLVLLGAYAKRTSLYYSMILCLHYNTPPLSAVCKINI